MIVEITRLSDGPGLYVVGRVTVADDGSVTVDKDVHPLVYRFATPPFVFENGKHVLRQVREGGRSRTLEDGAEFVAALPWAFGMSSSATQARFAH